MLLYFSLDAAVDQHPLGLVSRSQDNRLNDAVEKLADEDPSKATLFRIRHFKCLSRDDAAGKLAAYVGTEASAHPSVTVLG